SLGVRHLVAVAGQSYGGFQGFQWAIDYPDFMDGIVATVTAPRGLGDEESVTDLLAQLVADPNWNGGWHYDRGGIPETMTAIRMDTLRRYGTNEILAATLPDPAAREARMQEMAGRWVRPELPRDAAARDGALQRRAAPVEDPRARALRHLPLGRALPALDRSRRDGEALEGGRRRHLRRDRHRLRPPRRECRRREVGPGPH